MVNLSEKNKRFINPNIVKKTEFGQFYAQLSHISDKLQLAYHRENPEIVTLKNGNLYAVSKIDGVSSETEGDNDLDYYNKVVYNFLRSIGNEHLTVRSHILRRLSFVKRTENQSDNIFCEYLDKKYHAKLEGKSFFTNDLYLAIEYTPKFKKLGFLSSLTHKDKESYLDALAEAEEDFTEVLMQVKSFFGSSEGEDNEKRSSHFGAKPLGIRVENGVSFSEIAEFEALLLHNVDVAIPITGIKPLAKAVSSNLQLNFVKDAFEVDYVGRNKFVGVVLGIKDMPQTVSYSIFDKMLTVPFECSISMSFKFINTFTAISEIQKRLRKMKQANDMGVNEAAILTSSLEFIQNRDEFLGVSNCNFIVFGANTIEAKKNAAETSAIISEQGIITTRETFGYCEGGVWSRLGGNSGFFPRPDYITSSVFSCMSAFHNYRSGSKKTHWGNPLSVFKGNASNLFNFSWHVNDLGNAIVVGPSGSGKTVVLTFLIAQSLKQNIRTVFFDKDQGAEILIRALGGEYSTIVEGKPSGLAPLKAFGDYPKKMNSIFTKIDSVKSELVEKYKKNKTKEEMETKELKEKFREELREKISNIINPVFKDENLTKQFIEYFESEDGFDNIAEEKFIELWKGKDASFLASFIYCLLSDNVDGGLKSKDRTDIFHALVMVLDLNHKDRNFSSLMSLIESEEVKNALFEWSIEGSTGWLFDNDKDNFTDILHNGKKVIGFDITTILDNPRASTAFSFYAFNRVEELMTGEPIQIFFDEFWKALKSEDVAKFIENKLKVIRKQNGAFIGGTQSATDILQSSISSSIIDQCKTKILFPNKEARFDDYEKLGCSEKEFTILKSSLIGTRKFLVKKDDYSVIAELDLNGETQILKVLSGRAETIKDMHKLMNNLGTEDPNIWLPQFIDMEIN